jgi:hypothetical protein
MILVNATRGDTTQCACAIGTYIGGLWVVRVKDGSARRSGSGRDGMDAWVGEDSSYESDLCRTYIEHQIIM